MVLDLESALGGGKGDDALYRITTLEHVHESAPRHCVIGVEVGVFALAH